MWWVCVPAGSLTARSKSGEETKWTISSTSCPPWSPPVSPWLENWTSSPCCEKLSSTWNPLKVTHNAPCACRKCQRQRDLLVFTAGASGAFADSTCKPSLLPQDDLWHLLLRVSAHSRVSLITPPHLSACLLTPALPPHQTANGFLLVVRCDRAKILFISESVSKILNFSQVCCTFTDRRNVLRLPDPSRILPI